MTAATDPRRVVAWAVIDHATGSPWTCEPSQDAAERLAEQSDDTVQPLVPESLLAEAESALKNAQESEDIEYALRVKAESRIAALQSRLDAVVGLADGLAQRGCDMQARVDQSFAEEAEHTYYHGYTNVISESADAIHSAALGCATTGEMK